MKKKKRKSYWYVLNGAEVQTRRRLHTLCANAGTHTRLSHGQQPETVHASMRLSSSLLSRPLSLLHTHAELFMLLEENAAKAQ